jgi:quaternary ammonium compound-resistance protein SugE
MLPPQSPVKGWRGLEPGPRGVTFALAQGRPCGFPIIDEDDLISAKGDGAMPWLILTVAGLLEIGWAVGLKYTEGFTRLWPTVGTVASMLVSLGLLGLALRSLPVGTAYAVWTGIGTIGTALLGIALFGESTDPIRLACIGLILAGIVGLKLVTP